MKERSMPPFRCLWACAVLALAGDLLAQNPYQRRAHRRDPYADQRAQAVGDILTVVIREATKIKNEDDTERKTSTSLAASLESYTLSDRTFESDALPEIDIRSKREFKGESKQERDDKVEARVAVIVIDVLPNGNLVVAGSRVVRVDDEDKTLRISGIVRNFDVTKDNTVQSSQVADARVAITGEGGNTRAITRGPVGAFFDTLIWATWPF
jgi:flagellar L-ring protein precursor FlgH